jgi:hypothetical protein
VTSIRELEAALQKAWDDDTAAVYADALQAAGDPRGELVALDLHIARHGATRELEATRRDKLFAWLGGDSLCDRPWRPRDFRFGLLDRFFITSDTKYTALDYVAALVFSPAGPYLRSVQIFVHAEALVETLAILATRPLPWLRTMSIDQVGEAGPVPRNVVAAFEAAAPHFDDLALGGAYILSSPGFASVRTLRLSGTGSLVIGAAPMSHVTELDLLCTYPARLVPEMLNPRAFPAVQRLDLSRNEYVYPTTLDRNVGVFPYLREVEKLERIRSLRIPSLRTAGDVTALRELLDRYPRMHVEVARSYHIAMPLLAGLAHPRLTLPAEPRPWPPRDQVSGRDALTIKVPGHRYGEEIALSSCVDNLEDQFDAMPAEARTAWLAVWDFLDGLGWEDDAGNDIVLPFDAATLLVALEALEGDGRCTMVAEMIRGAKLAAGATVQIKRYWGW